MPEETLRKGERTRQVILDAAYQLFMEQGYHATSMRQIAEGSGLALGGIYNHFDGKEEIFREILLEHHPYKAILPHLLAAPGSTVEEFVRNAAQVMISELEKDPDFLKLMFIEVVEFNGRNINSIVDIILPQILPLINRFFVFRKDVRKIPPPVIFRAFLGMFFSYYITGFFIKNVQFLGMQEHALDQFVEIFLHGILKEEA